MEIFNDFEFLSKDLFYVDFDYNENMKNPFFKDLYKLFNEFKNKTGAMCYSFGNYLYAAHKASALLTMYMDTYGPRIYPMMYEVAYEYLCRANCHEGEPEMYSPHKVDLFEPYEIYFIQYLVFALLSVKDNPSIPFDVIELVESHVLDGNLIAKDFKQLVAIRESLPEKSVHYEYIKGYKLADMYNDCYKVKGAICESLKSICEKFSQSIAINTRLLANDWDDSCWQDEDITPWICGPTWYNSQITSPQYREDVAKVFLNFWKDKKKRSNAMRAIEEWSERHLDSFYDTLLQDIKQDNYNKYIEYMSDISTIKSEQLINARKQALNSLDKHLKTLKSKQEVEKLEEIMEAESPISSTPVEGIIQLNCGENEENTIIDVVRIFYVMHELGMFSHVHKPKLTKKDFFNALANFFNCPKIKNWSNAMSSARSQSNNDGQCHLNIFNTMYDKMVDIQKKLDKDKEANKEKK